jgi:hypothetical protein
MSSIIVVGRLGMVLVMIGLALGLISLFPPATRGTSFGNGSVQPGKYEFVYDASTLTPQIEVRISIESNGSLIFYLLRVSRGQLEDWATAWVRERFPDFTGIDLWLASHNMTVLEAFLESRPDVVLMKSEITYELSKEFLPATISNITGVIGNSSPNPVSFESEIEEVTSLAPREKILISAGLLVPIGFALVMPWVIKRRIPRTPLD